jgi:dimethylargininase
MPSATPCYRFDAAIVRTPAPSVVRGLRAKDRGNPDYEGLKAEHEAYVAALESTGVAVTVLPPLEAFPDSVFVEDPALVFPEGAVLLRPGAPSRQGEVDEIAPALKRRFGTVLALPPCGHADGGDVLVTPHAVLIGLSARTDPPGARALIDCLASFGHRGEIVHTPRGVLHLKTGCSLLDEETVLVARPLAAAGIFDGFRQIVLPEGEAGAANAVRLNDTVLVSSGYPQTLDLLTQAGYKTQPVPTAEVEKLDAGLSCMSLRWRGD